MVQSRQGESEVRLGLPTEHRPSRCSDDSPGHDSARDLQPPAKVLVPRAVPESAQGVTLDPRSVDWVDVFDARPKKPGGHPDHASEVIADIHNGN